MPITEIGNGELKIEDYEHVNYVDRVSCKEIICYLPDGTSQTCSLSEASDSRFSILDSQFLKARRAFGLRRET